MYRAVKRGKAMTSQADLKHGPAAVSTAHAVERRRSGRRDTVHPELVQLLRGPAPEAFFLLEPNWNTPPVVPREAADDLSPFRGLVAAIIVCSLFWSACLGTLAMVF